MTFDWVFFDAGNTLIGLNYGLVVQALERLGFSIDEASLRAKEEPARRDLDAAILARWRAGRVPRTGWVEGEVWRRYWRQVLEACGAPASRAEALVDAVLEVTRPASSWDRVDPATPGLLDELTARGHRLGVISNSNGTLTAQLGRLGLQERFEVIVDSFEVGVEKPHPDIFHLALRRAGGVRAERALHVGDVYAIDVLGAAAAGVAPVLFDPHFKAATPPRLDGIPDCPRVGSLADLLGLVG